METRGVNASSILATILVAFIVAVGVADGYEVSFLGAIYLGALAGVFLAIFYIEKKVWFAFCALAAVGLSLGVMRMNIAHEKIVGTGEYMEATHFKLRVTSAPVEKSYGTSVFAHIDEADGKPVSVGATVRIKTVEQVSYGDTVLAQGTLGLPEPFATNSGAMFDYPGYLHARRAYVILETHDIEVLAHGGNKLKKILFAIGDKFSSGMNASIREPELAFAKGVLLGDDSNISPDLQNAFVCTGTIHVLALSGYNVSIVAEFFKTIFSFLPKLFALGAGGAAIILFVIMTGGAPSAVRAGIMASIALFGKGIGRTAHAGMILLFAASMMILANPWQLLHDLGFQLSVVATWGILYIPRKIQSKFHIFPNPAWLPLREIIVTSCAAWIAVTPLILFSMHTFSPIAPLANLLVLPLMPAVMLFSFAAGFGALVLAPLGHFLGYITEQILSLETFFITTLSKISWSLVTIEWFGIVLLCVVYAMLFAWVYKKKEPRSGSF